MRTTVIWSAILMIFLASCDRPKPDQIQIETHVCLGTCPAYAVSVFSDGRLIYDGQNYVLKTGQIAGQLGASEFEKMVDGLNSVRPNGKKSYSEEPECPGGVWTDNPGITIRWMQAGQLEDELYLYLGCKFSGRDEMLADIHAALVPLKLERFVGTDEERALREAEWQDEAG